MEKTLRQKNLRSSIWGFIISTIVLGLGVLILIVGTINLWDWSLIWMTFGLLLGFGGGYLGYLSILEIVESYPSEKNIKEWNNREKIIKTNRESLEKQIEKQKYEVCAGNTLYSNIHENRIENLNNKAEARRRKLEDDEWDNLNDLYDDSLDYLL
jgi:hypothetical protein